MRSSGCFNSLQTWVQALVFVSVAVSICSGECKFDIESRLVRCSPNNNDGYRIFSGGCFVQGNILKCYGLPKIVVANCQQSEDGTLYGDDCVGRSDYEGDLPSSCRIVTSDKSLSTTTSTSTQVTTTTTTITGTSSSAASTSATPTPTYTLTPIPTYTSSPTRTFEDSSTGTPTPNATTSVSPTTSTPVSTTPAPTGTVTLSSTETTATPARRRRAVKADTDYLYCPGAPDYKEFDARLWLANATSDNNFTAFVTELNNRNPGCELIEGQMGGPCVSHGPIYLECAKQGATDVVACRGERMGHWSTVGCTLADNVLTCDVCDERGCGKRAVSVGCSKDADGTITCTGVDPFPGPCMRTTDGFSFECSNLPVKDLACRMDMNNELDCLDLFVPGEYGFWDLDLTNRGITTVTDQSFVNGDNIRSIDMSNNSIVQLRDGPFNRFQHLVSLNLSFNEISKIPSESFEELLSLFQLDLSNNKIREVAVNAFIRPGPLEEVYLQNNLITALPAQCFDSPLLKKLDVSGNDMDCCSLAFAAEEVRGGTLKTADTCGYVQRAVVDDVVTLFDQRAKEEYSFQPAYKDFVARTFDECVLDGRCRVITSIVDEAIVPQTDYKALGTFLRECDSCYASYRCDGSEDRNCVDGVDGLALGIPMSRCLRLTGTTCHPVGNNAECTCADGYFEGPNGTPDAPDCVDINECTDDPNPCEGTGPNGSKLKCRNTLGSYKCCTPGTFGANCQNNGTSFSMSMSGNVADFNASAAQSELEENVQDIFSREYQMSDTSVDLISVKPGSVIVEFVTSMQEERLAEILGNEMVIAELISELGVLSFSMGGNETVVDVEVLPTPSPNNTPSTPKVPLGVVIAIVAGVSLFLLLVLVIVLVVLKNYWKKHHEPDTAKIIEKLKKQHMWTEAHDTNASETLRAFKQSQENKGWLPRTAFTLLERIGGGAYGDVYRGVVFVENRAVVCAIKTMRKNDEKSKEEFLREIQILFKMDHHNIVSIIGASIATEEEAAANGGQQTVYLLLEFLGFGDLNDYLKAQTSISLAEKLWFSWQICKGLRYIAQTGTVHRDVAARNVLLGEATEYTHGHPTIKISDMGLARLVEDGGNYTKTSQGGLLPYRWMAPESIEYCAYSEKSDVWSFAMTVWEIFNDGKTPYAFLNDFKQVREALNRGLRESRTESMPVELYLMLTRCWDAAPDNRPDFSELEVLLGNMFMDHQTISDRGRFAMSLENESLSHDMLTRSESQTSSMFATSKDDILKTKAEAIAQYTEFSNSSANGFQNSREPVYIHLAGQRSIDTLQGSIVNGPRPRASNPTNPTRHSQVVTPLALQHAPSFGSSLSMPNDYAELPTPVMRATFFADSIPDVSADSDATANKPTEAPPVRSKTIYDNVTNTEESVSSLAETPYVGLQLPIVNHRRVLESSPCYVDVPTNSTANQLNVRPPIRSTKRDGGI